ncbi:MAG: hypothetical protein EOO07_17580 [Chitinophagaceae bacterium]|nr:MAG: hypothetical protein EOO07_17580 [Chitinophagaceae bacterium]
MKNIITLFLLSLVITSCGTIAPNSQPVYYTPGLIANDISYLPKPMESDSLKTQNYFSGSFAGATLPESMGDITMGQLNYHRAHTFKNIKLAYGTFVFFGGTKETGYVNESRVVSKDFDGRGFYGGGLRTSIGVFETSGNTEFRILNWENTLSSEVGSYSSLRRKLRNDLEPLSVGSDKNTLLTTGASTEIIWRGSRNADRNYGFRLFIGSTLGLMKNMNYTENKLKGMATDFSFFIKIKRAFATFSSGTNLQQYGSKITIGYAF